MIYLGLGKEITQLNEHHTRRENSLYIKEAGFPHRRQTGHQVTPILAYIHVERLLFSSQMVDEEL